MRTKVPKMATDPIKKRIVSAIQDSEIRIESELKVLKMAAIAMRDAKNKYHVAFFACRKKDNAKNSERYERAAESLRSCQSVFRGSEKRIEECLANIEAEYTRLMAYTTPRVADKLRDELALYKLTVEEKRRRFCKGVADPESTEDLDVMFTEADEPALPEPEARQSEIQAPQVAQVSIAPMAIDISSHVERAISATMAALTRRMEKRIDEYVASLVIPVPSASAVSAFETGAEITPSATENPAVKDTPVSENSGISDTMQSQTALAAETAEAADEIVNEITDNTQHEAEATKRLGELLSSLSDIMTELERLAKEQAEIAELQRRVNDMQRKTMRDQKGVQVNQRVINDDQTALIAEQNATLDSQRALGDGARALTEKQAALTAEQKQVIDAQTELDAAMMAVVKSQKELISAQGAVISGNARNLENQRALTEKQAELTVAQKQTFSDQRQLMREQRAFDKKRTMASKPTPDTKDEDK